MEITTELLKFNIRNLNDRIYTESSFEEVDLSKEFYGQIGQDREFNLSNSTHKIKDIRISDDGNYLLGTVEIFDKLLKDNITEFVFRPRILGVIDEGIVKVRDIISFDAVPCIEDSWYGIEDITDINFLNNDFNFDSVSLITNNFKDYLKEGDNLSILNEYMNYHLTRMNPSFYDSYEEDIDEMIYHKDLYDKSMLCMVSNVIEPDDLIFIITDMIEYYENTECYEKCSLLNNYLKNFKKEINYSNENE